MSKEDKEIPVEKEEIVPLEVKITNKDKIEKDTTYDSHDADEYDLQLMSEKEIEDFKDEKDEA